MSKVIYTLIFSVLVLSAVAQAPANADCETPVVITSGTTCVSTSGTNVGVENTTYDFCDFNKYMVWFQFTDTTTSHKIHITKGSIANYFVDVFQNNCNSLSRVSTCSFGSNNIDKDFDIQGFIIGQTYLIAVSTTEESDKGTFDICLTEIQPPANDECSGAISLVVDPSNLPTVRTNGTTKFATSSQTACSGNAQDDVWYSFTATQTSQRLYFKTLDFSGNPVIQLFSGTCGALVSMQCINPPSFNSDNSFTLLSGLTIGQNYTFRVHNNIGTNFGGTFSLGMASIATPANDNCTGAVSLTPATDFSQNIIGSTLDATQSQVSCLGGNYADDDVWYSFTATQTVHVIKVKGMTNNIGKIEVYNGNCTTLVLQDCEISKISGDTLLKEVINLTIGTTYFFRIYTTTFSPTFTTFRVGVTNPFISPYDGCENALSINVNSGTICTPTAFSIKGAYPTTLNVNCGAVSVVSKDIFLKFQATSTQHQIKITPFGIVTGQIFSGTCNNLTLMACGVFSLDSLAHVGGLTIGETYTIRLLSNSINQSPLSICINTPAYVANDEAVGAFNLEISGNQSNCKLTKGSLNSSSQSRYSVCTSPNNPQSVMLFDVWHKFTATSSKHRFYLLNTGSQSLSYELFGGSPSSLSYMSCASNITDSQSGIFENLVIGQIYFIRIYATKTLKSDYQICLSNLDTPINDECGAAQVLSIFQTWSSANYTKGSTAGSSKTIESNTCGAADAYDVWYKFTATKTSHFVAFRNGSVQQAIGGLTVSVYSGNCNTRIFKACKTSNFTDQSEDYLLVSALTIGTEYFVKVYSATSVASSQGVFELQILDMAVPTNDNCDSPRLLSLQPNIQNVIYVTDATLLSTAATQAINCSINGTSDDDLWYSFTASNKSVRLMLTANFKNTAFVVYSGTCAGLIPIECGSTGSTSFSLNKVIDNLVIGQVYLIRLYSFSNTQRGRVFIALTTDVTAPANDSCQNAISLMPSIDNNPSFTAGSTFNAHSTNTQCFTGDDVWYKFTATAAQQRIIYDGYIKGQAIAVFSGTCQNLSQLNNACFTGVHNISFTNSSLTIGQTYIFKVAAQTKGYLSQGNFNIAVVTPSIPPNDNCVNATAITSIKKYFSANLATNEFATSSICGSFGKDVWFKFTATKAKMTIELENLNSDAIMGLFKGTCPSPQLLKCSYQNISGQSSHRSNIINYDDLIIGDEYLINVAAFSNSIFLDFYIRIFENQPIESNNTIGEVCLGLNLVSNPSFENPETCPSSFVPTPSSPGQWLSPNLGWTIPTMGSPDYLHSCAAFNANIEVPRNVALGTQSPRNGLGYAGFFSGGSSYREYLHTELTSQMVVGNIYLLSMNVSRSDYYALATNNIGFGLSKESIIEFENDTLAVDKVLLPTNNIVIHEKDEWVNISMKFTADQAYKHLYLGNFLGEALTIKQAAVDISGGPSGGYAGLSESINAYYFVDDVFVGEVANTLACGLNPCDNSIVLISPTDNINNVAVVKTTNQTIKANILISGSSNVTFKAGKSILMDGIDGVFSIEQGVVFEAKIEGCGN